MHSLMGRSDAACVRVREREVCVCKLWTMHSLMRRSAAAYVCVGGGEILCVSVQV